MKLYALPFFYDYFSRFDCFLYYKQNRDLYEHTLINTQTHTYPKTAIKKKIRRKRESELSYYGPRTDIL